MGRTHSNGYKRVGDFFPALEYRPVLKVVCSRSEKSVRDFAQQWGYGSFETDWQKVVARDDIDAIVHERSYQEVWRAATASVELLDENAWIDDDADHAAPRSRRALCSSS